MMLTTSASMSPLMMAAGLRHQCLNPSGCLFSEPGAGLVLFGFAHRRVTR